MTKNMEGPTSHPYLKGVALHQGDVLLIYQCIFGLKINHILQSVKSGILTRNSNIITRNQLLSYEVENNHMPLQIKTHQQVGALNLICQK
jgi:hypothetical protein